jgi:hypothetical protein
VLAVNLVHEHGHRHGSFLHSHPHTAGHHGDERAGSRSTSAAQSPFGATSSTSNPSRSSR